MNRTSLLALAFVVAPATPGLVTGPAGVYTVTTSGPTRVSSGDAWVRLDWDTLPPTPTPTPTPPDPTPPPNPTPAPTPVPTLVLAPHTVIFVAEKNQSLTPGQRALQASTTIKDLLLNLNPRNQWASVDIKTVTIKDWLPEINKAGTPCVLILGSKPGGTGYEVIPQPADEASVLAEVQRLAAGGLSRAVFDGAFPSPQADTAAQERAAKLAEATRLLEEIKATLSKGRRKRTAEPPPLVAVGSNDRLRTTRLAP